MRVWSKILWSLLLTGILAATIRSHEAAGDDFGIEDEVVEEELSTEETEPAAEPMEKPVYKKPVIKGNLYFLATFEDAEEFSTKWRVSTAKKDTVEEDIAKYDGKWSIEEPRDNPLVGDLGLVLKSQAKHHAVAAQLNRPFKFTNKPFVVQYEVKFQNSQDCGGAYIKLLTEDPHLDLNSFHDKTPYTMMFGPDKCGNDHKLHFIFRHKNPLKGSFEEKHAKKPTGDLAAYFSDKKTHLYTLVVNPDNTFEVYVDQNMVNSGSLLEDVQPPVNPPKEITDPNDKKPVDWDEREKIPDPEATKPEDWDEDQEELIPDKDAVKPESWLEEEPELIPDPEAAKPADWDDDMDGEWEAPSISNPACENAAGCGEWTPPLIKNTAYKGKWRAPMVDNPLYKGKWTPRNIPNPDFFEDHEPFKMSPINAVGLELWSMSNDIYFDNFLIADDKDVADQFATETWELKHQQELLGGGAGKSVVQAVMDATKERPWLWAVFIVVVILPIVLVIAYCCMPGKGDDAAKTKKTDEPVPDDEADKKADEKSKSEGAGDSKDDSKKKASKSALEAEEEEEEDDADDEEDTSVAAEADRRTSPRRRKTKPQKE